MARSENLQAPAGTGSIMLTRLREWSGYLFFLVAAVMAFVFYKERISADAAHYLLWVVDSENFRIEHQRYILAFSQILPLIGVKLGLSLKLVMILNSLNPVLYFFGLWLYARIRLRDTTACAALILIQTLGVLNMYFCPMYEIWYGTGLIVLIYSHARQQRWHSIADLLLFLFLVYTALFAHPLLFIPVVFVLLFTAIERGYISFIQVGILAAVLASWYLIKQALLTSYEAEKMSLLHAKVYGSTHQLLRPDYWWQLVKFFFSYYTIPMLMYLVLVILYIIRRQRRKLILLTAFFIGHIILINYTHVNEWNLTLYFERMYMPMIPIVVIPFLYDMYVQMSLRNNIGFVLITLVVCWRLYCFADMGRTYVAERKHLQDLKIGAHNISAGSKFEISDFDYKTCYSDCDWSMTMQLMLLSGLDGPEHAVSMVTPDDMKENNNRAKLTPSDYLFRRWDLRRDDQINARYFRLKHGPYEKLPELCR